VEFLAYLLLTENLLENIFDYTPRALTGSAPVAPTQHSCLPALPAPCIVGILQDSEAYFIYSFITAGMVVERKPCVRGGKE
jgi:hypothetical protein